MYSPSRVPASTRHPGADDRRTDDLGVGIDLGALAEPHRLRDLEPGDVEADAAVEHVHVGAEVGVERADVLPVPGGDRADEGLAVRQQAGEHVAGEVDRLVPVDVLEDRGLEHVDAGVDGVAEHLAPRRLLEEALDGAVVAGDDDAELERVLDMHEADRRHRFALVVEGDDLAEVDVGEDVARDDEEPLVEQLAGVPDRPGGAERGVLVA